MGQEQQLSHSVLKTEVGMPLFVAQQSCGREEGSV